jgi:HK97 gp10 family phage protein
VNHGVVSVEVVNLRRIIGQFKAMEKVMDNGGLGEMKALFKSTGDIVANEAKARAPYKSGALMHSIRSSVALSDVKIRLGNAKTPYARVMEFGGTIPRHNSSRRTLVRPVNHDGYFFWPAFRAKRTEALQHFQQGFDALINKYF